MHLWNRRREKVSGGSTSSGGCVGNPAPIGPTLAFGIRGCREVEYR